MIRPRSLAFLVLAATPPSGAAQSSGPPLFDYPEHRAPVAVTEQGATVRDGVTVRVLRFPSPVRGEVPALLYEPERSTPGPALVILPGIPGDRTSWDGLARAYAAAGVTVLSVTAPPGRSDLDYREPRFVPAPLFSRWDSAEVVHTVVDLRRAVDLLEHHPAVDPDRIGYVGHSYGGYIGGLLAAVEPRLVRVALMAPTHGWATWMRAHGPAHFMKEAFGELPTEAREAWYASVEPLEWDRWVGGAPGERILVQLGLRDQVLAADDTRRVVRSLPRGARIQRFDAGHTLDGEAYRDQAAFLAGRLGFDPAAFVAPSPPDATPRP